MCDPPHPSERYYLFSLAIPTYDRYERLNCQEESRAIMNADYVFIRSSEEDDAFVEFSIYKNRSGRSFVTTPEWEWLKTQFPSLRSENGGMIRITDGRDLLLVKLFHNAEKCLNRIRR